MLDRLLVLNAGSSSLKFAVYEHGAGKPALKGQVEAIGVSPHLEAKAVGGTVLADEPLPADATHEALLGELLERVAGWTGKVDAAAHRVVHGGTRHDGPVRLDAKVLARLEALASLAPLHQPHNLAPIRALMALRPDMPQSASFDTAFHRGHDPLTDRFALPLRFEAEGIRRYGFHGLSYAYIAGRLREVAPEVAGGRVVVAHLGNGASLCAMRDGRSVETTMGFTALDGLPMGTRCGSLDPGVLLHLLRQGMAWQELEALLYRESGLKGLSGVSSDMRALLASDAPAAAEAVAFFCAAVAKQVAALACTLGGLDALVFTAGIGEHAAPVRADICRRLEWLGARLDEAANEAHAMRISGPASRVGLFVLPTDEEAVIAREAGEVLG